MARIKQHFCVDVVVWASVSSMRGTLELPHTPPWQAYILGTSDINLPDAFALAHNPNKKNPWKKPGTEFDSSEMSSIPFGADVDPPWIWRDDPPFQSLEKEHPSILHCFISEAAALILVR